MLSCWFGRSKRSHLILCGRGSVGSRAGDGTNRRFEREMNESPAVRSWGMSGASIGLRTGSYGSLQHLHLQNGVSYNQSGLVRKPSKLALSGSREKERFLSLICRYLGRRKVAMLLLVVLALLVFVFGSFTVSKGSVLPLCAFKMPLVFPTVTISYRNRGSIPALCSGVCEWKF